jgi:hypothetical protein
MLEILPVNDSPEMAKRSKECLDIERDNPRILGAKATRISLDGCFETESGEKIDIKDEIEKTVAAKKSIRPDGTLVFTGSVTATALRIQSEPLP